jgi:uncharacterized protein with FMN-binding domain
MKMSQRGGNKRVANSVVSASCAAVLAVYSTGYVRTQAAANRIAKQLAERRLPARVAAVPEPAAPIVPVEHPVEHAAEHATGHPAATPQPVAKLAPPPKTESVLPAVEIEPAPVEAPPPAPVVVEPKLEAPVPPPPPPPAPPAPQWKDGTYTGWGYSRHGNIEAQVVVEAGRIASAVISQCRTRYSCSVIERLPPQVAQRQSPNVDYVSGATQSADAFYGAVVEALAKAK